MEAANFFEAFEQLMGALPQGKDERAEMLNQFVVTFKTFITELEKVDQNSVSMVLEDLEGQQNNPVFQEVGRILRRFHDQMVVIKEGIPASLGKIAHEDVADVSSKLYHIIEMTDKAANTTMDLAEELMSKEAEQRAKLESLEQSLSQLAEGLEGDAAEKLRQAAAELHAMAEVSAQAEGKLTDILVAQDYQDLTGQVIHKILSLLKTLEQDLSDLIRKFGRIEKQMKADAKAEEVQLHGPQRDDSANKQSQDDVNSLLAEFGF